MSPKNPSRPGILRAPESASTGCCSSRWSCSSWWRGRVTRAVGRALNTLGPRRALVGDQPTPVFGHGRLRPVASSVGARLECGYEGGAVVGVVAIGALAPVLVDCMAAASTEQLQSRVAFDMNCPESQLQLYELDERTYGVRGCGQPLPYVESCDGPKEQITTTECTWVLNTDSVWARQRWGRAGTTRWLTARLADQQPGSEPPARPPWSRRSSALGFKHAKG